MDFIQRGPDKGKPADRAKTEPPRLRLAKAEECAGWAETGKERPGLLTDGPVSMSTSLRKAYQYASLVPKISQLIEVILAPEEGFEWENEKPAKGKPGLREVPGNEGAPRKPWIINKALLLEKMCAVCEDAAVGFETRKFSTLITRIESECPEKIMLPLDQKSLAELTNAVLILEETADLLEGIAEGVIFDGHMEVYEQDCARIYECMGALREFEGKNGIPIRIMVRWEGGEEKLMDLPELTEFVGSALLCKLAEGNEMAMEVPDWRTLEIGEVELWERMGRAERILELLENAIEVSKRIEIKDGVIAVSEGEVIKANFTKQDPAE